MTWNWQKSDWASFSWNRARLEKAEQQFLLGGGVLVGTVKYLPEEDRQQLMVDAMSTEAVTTSEIEGEILDRANVQNCLHVGLNPRNADGHQGPRPPPKARFFFVNYLSMRQFRIQWREGLITLKTR